MAGETLNPRHLVNEGKRRAVIVNDILLVRSERGLRDVGSGDSAGDGGEVVGVGGTGRLERRSVEASEEAEVGFGVDWDDVRLVQRVGHPSVVVTSAHDKVVVELALPELPLPALSLKSRTLEHWQFLPPVLLLSSQGPVLPVLGSASFPSALAVGSRVVHCLEGGEVGLCGLAAAGQVQRVNATGEIG